MLRNAQGTIKVIIMEVTAMTLDDVKQALIRFFSDDPVNWAKWAVVWAVFVLSYVIIIKCKILVKIYRRGEHKREVAVGKNHIVHAKLKSAYPYGDEAPFDWRATYICELNGRTLKYRTKFHCDPPKEIDLYYIDNSNKLYGMDETPGQNLCGIIALIVVFLPFALAVLAGVLIGVKV